MTQAGSPEARESPKTPQLSLEGIGGAAHRQLIDAQLAEERASKLSLEQRGFTVVTASGGLATLLFGLAAFAKTSPHLSLPAAGIGCLVAAVVLFVFAAAAGLITNAPLGTYEEAGIKPLQKRVEPKDWFDTGVLEAYRKDAQINVDILEAARKANKKKAWLLTLAVALDVLAIACVAVAVALVLV